MFISKAINIPKLKKQFLYFTSKIKKNALQKILLNIYLRKKNVLSQ